MVRIRGIRNGSEKSFENVEPWRTSHRCDGGGGDDYDDSCSGPTNDHGDNSNNNSNRNGNMDGNDSSSHKRNTNEKPPPHQHHPAYDPNRRSLDPRRGRRSLQHGAAPCEEGSSFRIVSAPKQPEIEGCYIEQRRYNGEAMYAALGEEAAANKSHGVIGAARTEPNDHTHIHWSLVYTNTTTNDDDKRNSIICSSVDMAQNVHPADALWACDFDGKGSLFLTDSTVFDLSCGCREARLVTPSTSTLTSTTGKPCWYGGIVVVLVLLCFLGLAVKILISLSMCYRDKTFGKRSLRPGAPPRTY